MGHSGAGVGNASVFHSVAGWEPASRSKAAFSMACLHVFFKQRPHWLLPSAPYSLVMLLCIKAGERLLSSETNAGVPLAFSFLLSPESQHTVMHHIQGTSSHLKKLNLGT